MWEGDGERGFFIRLKDKEKLWVKFTICGNKVKGGDCFGKTFREK